MKADVAFYGLLANAVLLVHFCYVTFTVGGEVIVLIGAAAKWRWVRNLPFRIVHGAAMVTVAVEALLGVSCPLTVWEYQLRVLAGEHVQSQIPFVARLLRSLIFYDFPAWVFIVAYVSFALLVVLTFLIVPPRPARRRRAAAGDEPPGELDFRTPGLYRHAERKR